MGRQTETLLQRVGLELSWESPSWGEREWLLRCGDSTLMCLRATNWLIRIARAELDGTMYRFATPVPLDPRRSPKRPVACFVAGSPRTLRSGAGARWLPAGRIEYGERGRAEIAPTDERWEWELFDESHRSIAVVGRPVNGLTICRPGVLRLHPTARDVERLALLIAFSWWLVLTDGWGFAEVAPS